jgi:hypothetical protein
MITVRKPKKEILFPHIDSIILYKVDNILHKVENLFEKICKGISDAANGNVVLMNLLKTRSICDNCFCERNYRNMTSEQIRNLFIV